MAGILLTGALGKMGRTLCAQVLTIEDLEVVAGVDIVSSDDCSFPVFNSFDAIDSAVVEKIDVIIDFSNPAALSNLLAFAVKHSLPAVIATTGLSDEQIASLHLAAEKIPVFFSANMSLGVNLLCELAKKAAAALGADFDIEIVEMHHNQKIDAPSGTALMLADAVAGELDYDAKYEYNRHEKREKRTKTEIGIHSLRGGTVTGEHQVVFAGNDEIITLSHSARSKALFSTGALNAARFLTKKQPGMYCMADLID